MLVHKYEEQNVETDRDYIVSVQNVTKTYGSRWVKETVIPDLSFAIERGAVVAIIGESGTGKTTILNMIGTLDKPTVGNIIVNGLNTRKMSQRRLNKFRNSELGFVFQMPYLLPEFNVKENILMPFQIRGSKPSLKEMEYINDLIERIGISEIIEKNVLNISGGQKQRVALARALSNNPSLVLADEPAASLDNKLSIKIYKLLQELNKLYGTTFIISTHNPDIRSFVDRIIEIHDGQIVSDTTINGV